MPNIEKLPERFRNARLGSLKLLGQGKVRDKYELPGHPDKFLFVTSDRISISDFVLDTFVQDKGAVLTALSVFWRRGPLAGFKHDIIAFGSAIDEYLPENDKGNPELHKRGIVVRKHKPDCFEAIVRGYLTGSGWEAYKETCTVCGHDLPSGLTDGSRLPEPIFTPSTKAEVGHDEHVSVDSIRTQYPLAECTALEAYKKGAAYALNRGVILADTKFELEGEVILDEVLTPDSSRFWLLDEWTEAQRLGKSPIPWDKQFVREWGKGLGINKRDPANPEDVAWVHAQRVPLQVTKETTSRYLSIFERLTSTTLGNFQNSFMRISD